ncbi:TIP120-domain-containing protein [Ceraceosorus guamensis]|uniref:TIP120-domain-containing protein n=1 Tax=Ceraceosorus guamensis TaxID=1522189 RepID=A0A316W1T1_9BASI|nr:TIP120-domain-containing protein [Ceraceosorus guamensis]PWN43702.1 TIP120-domain-containing protein [Ceraceosorus guamensis]
MSSRSSQGIAALLDKSKSNDADFRYMALSDLITELKRDVFLQMDSTLESKTVTTTLDLMKDKNAEVKNMAVRCLGVLTSRVKPAQIQIIVDRLVEYISAKEEEQRDIAALGLKTVLAELPADSETAGIAGSKLAPKLLHQIAEPSASQELLIDSTELLGDLFTRLPSIAASDATLQQRALQVLVTRLSHDRAAVRKRAVTALSALGAHSKSEVFTGIATAIITVLDTTQGPSKAQLTESQKTMVQLVGSLAKTCPKRIGRRLPELMPRVIAATQVDDDELREACLQCMEAVLQQCPSESTPFVRGIIDEALKLLQHDPNYAGFDGDDGDMEVDEDETFDDDDDEVLDEDYSDDDDLSWKARRASAKVLAAAIMTRPEQLTDFASSIAPVLVVRFAEREEGVRLEILQTFKTLLRQLQLYDGTAQATEVLVQSPGALKRKRDAMETDESHALHPRSQLRKLEPAIAKAMSKEINSKSVSTRFACYALLRELVLVLQGGLDAHLSSLIEPTEKALKGTDYTAGSAANLRGEVLGFFRLVFQWHESRAFEASLPRVVPVVISAIDDKIQRDVVEAFAVVRQLVAVLRPDGSAPSGSSGKALEPLANAVLARLSRADSDQEIRDRGIETIGDLVARAGDDLADLRTAAFTQLLQGLQNELTRYSSVKAVGQVASSPGATGTQVESFVSAAINEVVPLLRKPNLALNLAAFDTLAALLRKFGDKLDGPRKQEIVREVTPIVGESADFNLLPVALAVVSLVVAHSNDSATQGVVDSELIPALLHSVRSPLMQGAPLEAVTSFLGTYTRANSQVAASTIQALLAARTTSKKADVAQHQTTTTTIARCVGAVTRYAPDQASAVVQSARSALSSDLSSSRESELCFSLRLIGEVGRSKDLSGDASLLELITSLYVHQSDDVKAAAALAIGSLAVANPETLLPSILQQISATSDSKRQLLALQSLRELITHADQGPLAGSLGRVWTPLLEQSQSADEATRNIISECLARLTLTDPRAYLPQLHTRIHDPNPGVRASSIAAIRYTLLEASATFDEQLASTLVDFLGLMQDESLEVRRHAVFALNSAAHNKPSLISDQLVVLLPLLYKETLPRPELLRKVTMGPFIVTHDDGLDLRKTAYETMLTLLDTSFTRISLPEYMDRVIAGLSDEDGIKVLCYLILIRLSDVARLQLSPYLDAIATPITSTLKLKPKDAASKQDIERAGEMQRSIFRALIALEKVPAASHAAKFAALIKEARAVPHGAYEAAASASRKTTA